MPKVSITLPSIRPELLKNCIRRVEETAAMDDYEIVVVSDFPVEHAKVRWVEDTDKRGNCAAHARAFAAARGDIVVAMSDYIVPQARWLRNLVAFIEAEETPDRPFCAGLFWANSTSGGPTLGTIFGRYYAYYPAASRRSVEAVGGWFSPDYWAYFGDPDLGLRFWSAGGAIKPCWEAVVVSSHLRTDADVTDPVRVQRFADDRATFLDWWRHTMGAGWPVESMAQFNVDLPVSYVDFDDLSQLPRLIQPTGNPTKPIVLRR